MHEGFEVKIVKKKSPKKVLKIFACKHFFLKLKYISYNAKKFYSENGQTKIIKNVLKIFACSGISLN